jgi:hypothetical protein
MNGRIILHLLSAVNWLDDQRWLKDCITAQDISGKIELPANFREKTGYEQ